MTTGRPFIAIVLLAALAGCGTSDDRVGRMLVAPGKYTLYSCDDMARQAVVSSARARELERLMAKASVDASGRFVSAVAYRPEYLEKRGELNELRNAALAKKCKAIPALDTSSAPASDGVVR